MANATETIMTDVGVGFAMDNTKQPLQINEQGLLMVCLCDGVGERSPGTQFEYCKEHRAVPLKTLKGWGIILHAFDERGDIQRVEYPVE